MKNDLLPVSPRYWKAIREGLLLQILICLMGLLILDGGGCAQICGIALAAFWGAAAVMICRRPMHPTKVDLSFIRIGYVAVLPLALLFARLFWAARGFHS